jgi:hypothetical protein
MLGSCLVSSLAWHPMRNAKESASGESTGKAGANQENAFKIPNF